MNQKLKKLDIAVAAGNNSDQYVEYMLNTFERTISSELTEIRFIIGLNTSKFDFGKIERFRSRFNFDVINIESDLDFSSMKHGVVLNELFAQIKTEVGMFIDCDVACVAKDWDQKMFAKLDEKHVIVGTEYHINSHMKKYAAFPNAIVCMFKTDVLRDLKIDFRPVGYPLIESVTVTDKTAPLYNRRPGEVVCLDVGHELPVKIKSSGFDGVALPFVNPGIGSQMFSMNGVPAFLHLKGSTLDGFINPRAQAFKNYSERLINQQA